MKEDLRVKRSLILFVVFVLVLSLGACTAKDKGVYEGSNGKWTVTLSDKFGEGVAQKTEGLVTTSYATKDGLDLKIIEAANPGYVADEKRLEEETTAVDELIPTRVEVLDIENFGKVYGAVVTDSQMGSEIFYYMTNVGDDVIYLMFVMQEGQLTEAREKEVKAIVMSLTLK